MSIDKSQLNSLDIALMKVHGLNNPTTVDQVKQNTANVSKALKDMTNLEVNEFYEKFINKVFSGHVLRILQFRDPISAIFFKESANSWSAGEEITDSDIYAAEDYNVNSKIMTENKVPKQLRTVIHTVAKKVIPITEFLISFRTAFASPQAYEEWSSRVKENIYATVQVELFNHLRHLLKNEVVNEITVPETVKSWDELFIFIKDLMAQMKLPSKNFSIGYESKRESDGTIVKKDNTMDEFRKTDRLSWDNVVLITSPRIINDLKTRVSASKIHNEAFSVDQFKKIIEIPAEDAKTIDNKMIMYIVADNSFYGRFRVTQTATQYWAKNLTIDTFYHYWYLFGMIPWAMGFRLKFTKPIVDNSITLGTVTTKQA